MKKKIVIQLLEVFGEFLYLGGKGLFGELLSSVHHVLVAKNGRFVGEARAHQSEGKAHDRPNLHRARRWQRLSPVVKRQVANGEDRVSRWDLQRMGLMGHMGPTGLRSSSCSCSRKSVIA